MGLILLIIIVAAIVFFIKDQDTKAKKAKPITPPSTDVYILGCQPDCGYFAHKFYKMSNGDYEFVRRNGRLVATCNYQHCEVCQGSPCQFAKDHPDRLGKGIFDDDI